MNRFQLAIVPLTISISGNKRANYFGKSKVHPFNNNNIMLYKSPPTIAKTM